MLRIDDVTLPEKRLKTSSFFSYRSDGKVRLMLF